MNKVFQRIWKDQVVWGKLNGDHAFVYLSDRSGICCHYSMCVSPILVNQSIEQIIDKGFVPNADQSAPVPCRSNCATDPRGEWLLIARFVPSLRYNAFERRYPTFCGALMGAQEALTLAFGCYEVEIKQEVFSK